MAVTGSVTGSMSGAMTRAPTEGVGAPYTGPQIVIVGYGQSNWLNMLSTTSSPEAASAGTYAWDNVSAWGSVPNGNGIRKLLNDIAASVGGKTVGVVYAGVSGVDIAYLMEGSGTEAQAGAWLDLKARLAASGCRNAEEIYIVWHQGEGDATGTPNAVTHTGNLNTLHQSIVDEIGKTKAQCPFILSGLATCPGGFSGAATNAKWAEVEKALVTAHDTYANIHYSHNNKDATLVDGVHWNAASYGRSGARYARTVLNVRGTVATRPAWFIASAAIVDATHTDVTVVHAMGTDFTPTSAITGFTLSIDGWATPVTPSAADRQSATVIRLTHSSLATTSDRLVRYQYGLDPDVSAPVLDNGSLASPLNFTDHQVVTAAGSAALPVPTWINAFNSGSNGQNQTVSSVDIGSTTNELMVIVAGVTQGGILSTITLTPNAGSPISGTIVRQSASGAPGAFIASFIVPAGTTGANNCAIAINHTSNPFATERVGVWTVPTANLNSTTAVDSDVGAVVTSTTQTLDISTSADGFYVAAAVNMQVTANSTAWTGDEAGLAERNDTAHGGCQKSFADASGTVAGTNDNTITATFAQSSTMRVVAASWR